MFSQLQTKELEALTRYFLLQKQLQKSEIEELRNVLRFHEYRYYVMDDPLIADNEYDQVYKQLERIEKENPELITQGSPTQRVAKGLTKEFPTVQHLVPMLSLENSYDAESDRPPEVRFSKRTLPASRR